MYCKKCGKFIGNDSELCDECRLKQDTIFSEFSEKKEEDIASVYSNVNVPSSNQISLGKSIAAIILSDIGFFLIYMGLILFPTAAAYVDFSGAIAFMIFGAIPSLLGLIFGIQSISYFRATSMIRSGKRIPVLILGISSVVMAAIGLIIVFMMFAIYDIVM
ncbi:MAG: hypothetical protein J6V68_05275 [Clostridia bacterium]|nr:hypothetical protein [Clostridia bacterium]